MYEENKDLCRILFIIPSLGRAGAEMQVVNLINNLDRDRFEVFLFTFDNDLSLRYMLADSKVICYNQPRRYKFDFSPALKIAEIIDKNKIDIIHCSLQIALFFGWLGQYYSKRKPAIINTLHRTKEKNNKEFFLEKLLYQWPMRRCKKVICVCNAQEEYWQMLFPFLKGRTVVIYNGVDTNYFNPAGFETEGKALRIKLGIPPDAPVISCIAGLRVEKNHIGLIKAFSQLDLDKLDLYLLLSGEGPERKNIEQVVAQLRLNNRVFLLGNMKDVRPVLKTSCLTLITSTTETFSMAMLESMAMERPVITTDIGGNKEAVRTGITGEVIPVNKTEFIVDALNRCLGNRQRLSEMGKNARQEVIKNFSLEKMVRETEVCLSVKE